jgi:hypothetical protein
MPERTHYRPLSENAAKKRFLVLLGEFMPMLRGIRQRNDSDWYVVCSTKNTMKRYNAL